MTTDKRRNLLSLGLVVGALVGAIAAYFYAPKKGADTQKILARKGNQYAQTMILKTQEGLLQIEKAIEDSMGKNE